MRKSFNSTGSVGMISTALSTARTLAISHQKYAGVRFQKAGDPNNVLKADQYMIFVTYQPTGGSITLTTMFRAVEGYKPIKLPENIGVVDMMVRTSSTDPNNDTNDATLKQSDLSNTILGRTITDTSAFSVVFSPAGKLVIQDVRTRNKKGDWRPSDPNQSGRDDVFNSYVNIKVNKTGQFIQDDYAQFGLGGEKSRREFYIYNRNEFEKLTTGIQRMNYLNGPKTEKYYVNPYTGDLIGK
jgi:Tfp pilus assembly protein FimT